MATGFLPTCMSYCAKYGTCIAVFYLLALASTNFAIMNMNYSLNVNKTIAGVMQLEDDNGTITEGVIVMVVADYGIKPEGALELINFNWSMIWTALLILGIYKWIAACHHKAAPHRDAGLLDTTV